MDLSEDHALAARLADAAGGLLLQLRAASPVEGKALGALGDQVANAFLMGALRELRPDDGILSEEEAPNTVRLSKSRVWVIDPLDGTREFSEGRADWAVHVALTIDGRPIAGAVAIPGFGVTYTTAAPTALAACANRVVLVSRTRPPLEAEKVARSIDGSIEGMGSAGAKSMAVGRGDALAYVHSGGQYEWDSCAPAAVAKAMGLHVSRLDGSETLYNRQDPYMPDLLVCRPELADTILRAINS